MYFLLYIQIGIFVILFFLFKNTVSSYVQALIYIYVFIHMSLK